MAQDRKISTSRPCGCAASAARCPCARSRTAVQLWLGKISETRILNPKNPSPNPENPSPKNPNTKSGFSSRYPKLLWIIRVSTHGTRTTRKTRTTAQPKYFHSFQPSPTNLPNSLTLAADAQGPQRTPPPHPRAARGQHPPRPTQARRSGAHGRRSPPNHLSVSLSNPLHLSARSGGKDQELGSGRLPVSLLRSPAGLRVGASLAEPPTTPPPPPPVSASAHRWPSRRRPLPGRSLRP